jgi:uncharacterized membrane protein (DUF4010 family)
VSVLLIAALGFVNYILLNLYGARGIEFTGFLGGLVNSTVTVTELSTRVRDSGGQLGDAAFRGVILATAAMLVRNAIILGLLAPAALASAIIPITLMIGGAIVVAILVRHDEHLAADGVAQTQPPLPLPVMASPFSLASALRFGVIFLILQAAATLAARLLGEGGLYALSAVGGMVSSASTVASTANLATAGSLTPFVAGTSAVIASVASSVVDLPLISRFGRDKRLTRRSALLVIVIALLGAAGVVVSMLV